MDAQIKLQNLLPPMLGLLLVAAGLVTSLQWRRRRMRRPSAKVSIPGPEPGWRLHVTTWDFRGPLFMQVILAGGGAYLLLAGILPATVLATIETLLACTLAIRATSNQRTGARLDVLFMIWGCFAVVAASVAVPAMQGKAVQALPLAVVWMLFFTVAESRPGWIVRRVRFIRPGSPAILFTLRGAWDTEFAEFTWQPEADHILMVMRRDISVTMDMIEAPCAQAIPNWHRGVFCADPSKREVGFTPICRLSS